MQALESCEGPRWKEFPVDLLKRFDIDNSFVEVFPIGANRLFVKYGKQRKL
jgi:hypothetical protein